MSTSGISFSGLFSGLDTESIIEQLMEIERQPIVLLEEKQTKLNYEKTALQEINTSLLALKTSIKSFADGLIFENVFNTEDEGVVSGTATAAASQAEYEIEVLNLAKGQVSATDAKAAGYTMGAGPYDFTITVDGTGEDFVVSLAGGEDLTAVAQAINTTVGSGGTTFTEIGIAQVITDPVNNTETLVIKSRETGTENAYTFTDGTNNPLGAGLLNLSELQGAVDAKIEIDGVQIESSTNIITDAINGVTLNLESVSTPGVTTTVSVGLDEEGIISKVSDFIEQFNATTDLLTGYITEDTVEDPETTSDLQYGILRGDMDLISTKSQIRLRTTGYVDTSLADYQILSQIGITSEASAGSMVSTNIELDEEKLRAALSDDMEQVADLLEGWADSMDEYLEAETDVSVVQSMAGNYYRRILNIDDRIDSIDDDIVSWEERVETEEERLREQFAAMEEALSELQTQSDYLTSQLSSLSSSSD